MDNLAPLAILSVARHGRAYSLGLRGFHLQCCAEATRYFHIHFQWRETDAKHGLRFVALAFDSLGHMHPNSATLLHRAFITDRLESTQELLPSRNALWR